MTVGAAVDENDDELQEWAQIYRGESKCIY